MTPRSKATSQARDTKVIGALGKHFNATQTFQIGGKSYKVKELQQLLQSHVDAGQATDSARTTWIQSATAEAQLTQEVEQVLLGLKQQLVGTYGASSTIVSDFGFTPKKPVITPDVAAAAVKKRLATRTARGTMGKKQKAGIKGVVTPETPAPATAAPAETPAAAKPVTAS